MDIVILAFAFSATFVLKVNVVYIILAAALIGVIRVLWMRRKGAAA